MKHYDAELLKLMKQVKRFIEGGITLQELQSANERAEKFRCFAPPYEEKYELTEKGLDATKR